MPFVTFVTFVTFAAFAAFVRLDALTQDGVRSGAAPHAQ